MKEKNSQVVSEFSDGGSFAQGVSMSVIWSDTSAAWRDHRFVNVVLFRASYLISSLNDHFHVAESLRHRSSEGFLFDLRHVEEERAISKEVFAFQSGDTSRAAIAFVVRSPWTAVTTNFMMLCSGQPDNKRMFLSRYSAKKWLARQAESRRRDAARYRVEWVAAMKPYVS